MTEKILSILREINPYEEINERTQLIDEAILDSLTLVVLINEIERIFCVKIPEEKLQPDFFKDVPTIVKMIKETE